MPGFRNIFAWLVLTSYVFANTFAAALHDHRDCCGHSEAVHHHADGEHRHGDESVAEHDHDGAGDELYGRHHCAVCEFLAHAPLKAPVAAPAPAGDLLPDVVSLPVERFANAAPGTHLARGPPPS